MNGAEIEDFISMHSTPVATLFTIFIRVAAHPVKNLTLGFADESLSISGWSNES